MKPFVFFSFVLIGILWLIQSMPRLDDVISNGQSGLVFIKISSLIFPQVMLIVLPISAFASTIYAIHKLISESELLIFANAGISNTRLIMPILIFGSSVCTILYFLSLYLVPLSQNKLRTDLYNIREEFSNRLIKDQQFFHPIKGVTIYIRESTDNGNIKGIFITDARQNDNRVTYSAREAIMSRTENGLMLVMQNGLLQVLDSTKTALTTLKFKRMGFELNNFLPIGPRKDISPVEIFPFSIISNYNKLMKNFLYSIIIIYSLIINVYADVSDKISAKVNDYFSNLIPGNGITEVSIDLRENNSPDFSILAVRELEKSLTGNIFTQFIYISRHS